MTEVRWSDRAADFLAAAGDYLRSRPAEHSVILTNAELRLDPSDTNDLWAWTFAGDEVVAALMHTPPFGAYVSLGPDDAMTALVAELRERGREVPGVGGPERQAEVFAAEWVRRTGTTVEVTMRQGLYVVDELTPPSDVPGGLRRAESGDIPLLREWVAGFHADTHLPVELSGDVADRVATGRLRVWVDAGEPVSMAASSVPAGGVSRIQLVYTPKPLRGRGYASACVAAVTAEELAVPGHTCMLYTDLANPTSNGVYQAIGYRRIGDAVQFAFD